MTFSVNESSGEIGQDWGRAKRRNNQNSNRRTQYWAHQHVRILFGCYKREWWRWDRTMQKSYDKCSINRAQGNRKLWFQLHKSMYILHMDYLIKTGEWQKLQQLRWHGDTMDGLFPKFSLTLIFWQLLGNKYKVKKKKKSQFWHSSSLPITIHSLQVFFPITIQCYRPHATPISTVPRLH